jgi:ProP effector
MMTNNELQSILTALAEFFPRAFTVEHYLPHKPLKVGIDVDLAAQCPALERKERAVVLRFYTSRVMYLRALTASATRVDLDGNPAGTVTDQEAEHAAARLAGILAAREAKRQRVKADAVAKAWKEALQKRAAGEAEAPQQTESPRRPPPAGTAMAQAWAQALQQRKPPATPLQRKILTLSHRKGFSRGR